MPGDFGCLVICAGGVVARSPAMMSKVQTPRCSLRPGPRWMTYSIQRRSAPYRIHFPPRNDKGDTIVGNSMTILGLIRYYDPLQNYRYNKRTQIMNSCKEFTFFLHKFLPNFLSFIKSPLSVLYNPTKSAKEALQEYTNPN